MAINKNHEFEELEGIKCGIVEKNVQLERSNFLKELLTINGFNVIVVPSPPSKTVPVVTPKEGDEIIVENTPLPASFTVGVTDYTFNTTNAIFGRMLKTKNGHVVTQAYWNQKEEDKNDEIPYYQHNA